MPSLNFLKQFALDVQKGIKTHTIRRNRLDGRDPTVGDILYFYTGLRTKGCRKLGEGICTYSRSVEIVDYRTVTVDGQLLNATERKALAENDGFSTIDDFVDFFKERYGLPFNEGRLIKWRLRNPKNE